MSERSWVRSPVANRPKSLKLGSSGFLLGAHDYGNSTTTGPPESR